MFALSFVALGVGNAGGLGFQDLFNGSSGSSSHTTTPAASNSLTSAIAGTHRSPSNPASWQALGAAYSSRAVTDTNATTAQSDYQAAVNAYTHARTLTPTNPAVLRSLADAYTALAGFAAQQAQTLQSATATNSTAASIFIPGGAPNADAFTRAEQAASLQQQQSQIGQLTSLQTTEIVSINQAQQVALTLTRITPTDPTAWFNLGQTAQQSRDIPTAIRGYKQFLALVPGDPLAPQVRQAITALQASIAKPKPHVTNPTKTHPAAAKPAK